MRSGKHAVGKTSLLTPSIAALTRSDLIMPFCARLVIKAAFVFPELRHAMVEAGLVILVLLPGKRLSLLPNAAA